MDEVEEAGSITHWIDALKGGDREATRALWDRYFPRLVRVATSKLGAARHAGVVEDGEDAALSAFGSFFGGLAGGKFPEVADRDDLWQLLVVIAARKAYDQVGRARARKRGGGRVVGESALAPAEGDGRGGLDAIAGAGPTPELAAMVLDQCRTLLESLPDDEMRDIAVWKMEGYTRQEIADRLGCSPRTIAYRLEYIRKAWEAFEP